MLRVLFIANLATGATAHHRLNDFLVSDQYIILTLDTEEYFPQWRRSLSSPFLKLGFGPPFSLLHLKLIGLCRLFRPDILWIEKNLYIPCNIISRLKREYNCKFVHFMHDDFTVPGNSNPIFRNSLRNCDVLYTTKSQNLSSYSQFISPQKIYLVDNCISEESLNSSTAYDSVIKRWDICFIGRYEPYRELFFKRLIEDTNYRLLIAGPGWTTSRLAGVSPSLTLYDSLWGHSYSTAISQSRIAVNLFTRKTNDTQTSRLLEIPIYGSVLISEISSELHKFNSDYLELASFESYESFLIKLNILFSQPSLLPKIHNSQVNTIKSCNFTWKKNIIDPLPTLLNLCC